MAYRIKKPKQGREYEKVVAEIYQAFDPSAIVTQGAWVVGPDGRRELDVQIQGTAEGRPTKAIIECKDFNPKGTGPVGINYIDALDSKRHDLGAQVSMLCANAGFTADAIRKAKRVKIGLISVMKKGDHRLRYAVVEEVYTRKIKFVSASPSIQLAMSNDAPNIELHEILYDNRPLLNWVIHRIGCLIGDNPIVNGTFTITHRFSIPLVCMWAGGSADCTSLTFTFTIEGGWLAHQCEIDSTAGIFDWIRRRIRMVPGGGQVEIKGINVHEGEHISLPPEHELMRRDLLVGERIIHMALIEGLSFPAPGTFPDIDKFLLPEESALTIPELNAEAMTSSPNWT